MTDNTPAPETLTVQLESLDHYVILGVDKNKEDVVLRSGRMTVSDLAALLARAQVSLDVEKVRLAIESYQKEKAASKSPLILPTN